MWEASRSESFLDAQSKPRMLVTVHQLLLYRIRSIFPLPSMWYAHGADAGGMLQTALSLKILLIDDSPVALRALRTVLGLNPNWRIVGEAESGAEGLRMFRETAPDIVIVDFQMPGMNGLEVGKKFAERMFPSIYFCLVCTPGPSWKYWRRKLALTEYFQKLPPIRLSRSSTRCVQWQARHLQQRCNPTSSMRPLRNSGQRPPAAIKRYRG